MLIYALLAYAFFAYITLSALLSERNKSGTLSGMNAAKAVLFSILWPIYWPTAKGPEHGTALFFAHVFGFWKAIIVQVVSIPFDLLNWLLVKATELMRTMFRFFTASIGLYMVLGLINVPALYLHRHWNECSGLFGCSGEVLQSLCWALSWPAYFYLEIHA